MSITSLYERIDAKAYQLLLKLNALVLPVNIERIAEILNLSIQEKTLEDEYSGFLAVREKPLWLIHSTHQSGGVLRLRMKSGIFSYTVENE